MGTIGYILLVALIKALVVVTLLLLSAATLVWLERRIAGYMQDRFGPNRLGPLGLLQPFADVIKLFMKEDIVPDAADKKFHGIAPMITLAVAVAIYGVIPFADPITQFGSPITMGLAVSSNINVGVLYILALTGIGVYGVTLAGWSSNNKYSLMGGIRSCAQMISYEIAMGLALIGLVMVSGSFGMTDIVHSQQNWAWNLFRQPLGFLVYLTAAFAEMNRTPFDLAEAEQELVAGYNTEYTGMKFGSFFLGEYANIATSSVIISLLFLGGWDLPVPADWLGLTAGTVWMAVAQFIVLAIKVFIMSVFIIWVRWSIPRFRYDQLMNLGWKVLLPVALINIAISAVGIKLFC